MKNPVDVFDSLGAHPFSKLIVEGLNIVRRNLIQLECADIRLDVICDGSAIGIRCVRFQIAQILLCPNIQPLSNGQLGRLQKGVRIDRGSGLAQL